MSVILTDMDMPNSCYECRLKTRCEYALANGWLGNKRDDKCPLKPYEERKIGRWSVNEVGVVRCPFCHANMNPRKNRRPKYCDECGAKMEGAKE